MNITVIFLIGLVVAIIGATPPGLLNMTAAKVSLKEGSNRGIMFSLGVCLVFAVQALVAMIFSKYLQNHPDVTEILQRVAFVIFVLITIYFFRLAKKQPKPDIESEVRSKRHRFFQGMLLTSLNMITIPYHAYIGTTVANFGWMMFDSTSIASYVAGSTSGTFIMMYVYIFFFDKIKDKPFTSQKSMNYIIGSITGIIAVFTLINIIKDL